MTSFIIKSLEDISRRDAETAGGKGASLGEMTQAGIPVPPGFVILADAFEKFLIETDLNVEIDTILHSVDIEKMYTVEHASETIQKFILEAKMPEDIVLDIREKFDVLGTKFVAVRSSATAEDSDSAAWAGQLDSFLNTTEETLLKNVQRCFASLFTPRAIFYRFEKELHKQKISVAVVVQKMVESEFSGIAFSVHPVTEDRNQLIIEAGFGLGEAIVSGQVTPDSYVVEKEPRKIIDINISEQPKALYRKEHGGNEWKNLGEKGKEQVLNTQQILELSELIIHIENHYGFPCDIEWAYAEEKFYITQSRPITTLLKLETRNEQSNFDFKKWLSGNKLEFLYRHKYPLLNAELFFYTTKFCNNVLGNHHKNFIFTLSNKELVAYYFLDELKLGKPLSKKLLDDKFFVDHFDGSHLARKNVDVFIEKYEKYIKKIKKSDIDHLNIFQEYWKVYAGVFAYFRTSNPALVDPFIEELRVIINSYPLEGVSVENAMKFLTTPFSSNLITQETEDWFRVLQVPANTEVFKSHISKYLWLFISTYDFNSALFYLEKRYETDHSNMQDMKVRPNEFSNEAKEAEEVRNKFYRNPEIKRLSTIILTLTDDRLLNKCAWTGLDFQVRELFKIMAEKASISIEDFINSYTYDDVTKLFTSNQVLSKEEMCKRLLSFTIISDNLNHVFLSGDESLKLNEKINFSQYDGGSIEGISASKGCVVGKVFIVSMKNVTDLQDQLKNFIEGDILVAGMTEPNLIPYMIKSGGIITDQGGLTSHAAIIARELKKPCIVGTKIATQVLKTGDRVELNANTGFIKIK